MNDNNTTHYTPVKMSLERAVIKAQHRDAYYLLASGDYEASSDLYLKAPTAEMVRILCKHGVPLTADVVAQALRDVKPTPPKEKTPDLHSFCGRTLPTLIELLTVAYNNGVPIDAEALQVPVDVIDPYEVEEFIESSKAYTLIYLHAIVSFLYNHNLEIPERFSMIPPNYEVDYACRIMDRYLEEAYSNDEIMEHQGGTNERMLNTPLTLLDGTDSAGNYETLIWLGVLWYIHQSETMISMEFSDGYLSNAKDPVVAEIARRKYGHMLQSGISEYITSPEVREVLGLS